MGCNLSRASYISSSNGSMEDYRKRFYESKTLGEGEFGVVKLAYMNKDMIGSKPIAVKYLRKGFSFKDNTIYTPIKKEALVGEVEILRKLNGEYYNLKLIEVYEGPSIIIMVTEYCEGGEMIPYVTKAFANASTDGEGLRTEDVSRIAYQLWSALDHCDRHGVIHRDIKPQNIMFCTTLRDSELRLIDFGSGTLDRNDNGGYGTKTTNATDGELHHTYAGTAFYISPEMFQKAYTSKTDVWSAGATLYVLVAGYPADRLQETFNILQCPEEGRLKRLPNMPDNMPSSFYDMLEGALAYGYKSRLSATQLMKGEFSQFHISHSNQQDCSTASNMPGNISIFDVSHATMEQSQINLAEGRHPLSSLTRTKSVLLEGSLQRHGVYLGYLRFERSITTLLVTMLSRDGTRKVLRMLSEKYQGTSGSRIGGASYDLSQVGAVENINKKESITQQSKETKLQVIPISDLLDVVRGLQNKESEQVISMIAALDKFDQYQNFAYHIALLQQFMTLYSREEQTKKLNKCLEESGHSRLSDKDKSIKRISSVHGANVFNNFTKNKALNSRIRGGLESAEVVFKDEGNMTLRRTNTATGALNRL